MIRPIVALCGFVTASVLAASGVQNPSLSEPGAVSGVVTDRNTGLPLSGMVVTLTGRGGVRHSADTDASGRFETTDLPPGRYSVGLSAAGFLSTRHVGPPVVDLRPRQVLEDLRFGAIRASAISGRVLDEDRTSVPAATVVAMQIHYDAVGQAILLPPNRSVPWDAWAPGRQADAGLQVLTDEAGRYRLHDLDPGEYYIGVWARLNADRPEGIVPAWYYPGVFEPAYAAQVVVRPGVDLNGIDVRVADVPGYSVSFTVESPPCDSRAPSRRFHIVRRSPNGMLVTEGASRITQAPALPDFDDPFERIGQVWIIPELFPGTYHVYYSSCYGGSQRTLGELSAYVADEDVNAGVMTEQRTLPLRGRVTLSPSLPEDLLSDRALIVVFRDLESRTPYVFPMENNVFAGISPNTVRPDGTFEYPLLPGRYAVNLSNLGDIDGYVASARVGGREVLGSGFVWDGAAGDLEFVVDSRGGIVEGVVRDDDRDPVAGAQVVLVPPPAQRSNPTLFRSTVTDQSGVFSFRQIPPGEYGILAWDELERNSWMNGEFLARFERRARTVRIEKGTVSRQDVTVIPGN